MTIALYNQHHVRRFLTKTRWGGGPDGTCLEWTAYLSDGGYGRFQSYGKFLMAHRVAWEWKHGPIPDGLQIDHIGCRNRRCVNVEHLRLVTPKVQALENSEGVSALNAVKTHCKSGHEFSDENTYVYQGKFGTCRVCRICLAASDRRYRQKKKVRA